MCSLHMIDFSGCVMLFVLFVYFFFKQKTAYEMRISDWSSDVCSSDLPPAGDAAEADGGDLCRLHRRDGRAVLGDAFGLHPGAGSGLFPHRHPIAAGLDRKSVV